MMFLSSIYIWYVKYLQYPHFECQVSCMVCAAVLENLCVPSYITPCQYCVVSQLLEFPRVCVHCTRTTWLRQPTVKQCLLLQDVWSMYIKS